MCRGDAPVLAQRYKGEGVNGQSTLHLSTSGQSILHNSAFNRAT